MRPDRLNQPVAKFRSRNRWLSIPSSLAMPSITAMMLSPQAVVKTVDMEEAMEKDAIDTATQALNEFTVESQMANFIKK